MSDSINPDHYRNGPFECIELARLLSFEWGNVVKYCFRWKGKNGVEDLDKAVWYAKDAIMHGVPLTDEGGIMRRIVQTIRQILMIPALLSIYLALAIIEHRERRRGRK